MASDAVPVLWLCGPPGVGKTSVGWEIFSGLSRDGVEVGYVDIDQLGMCYPESAADPDRHRLKAGNLAAVVANFRAAGARCVIVSGVVDAVHGIHADQIPGAELTVCRLRTGRDELRQRFVGRGDSADLVESVLRDAEDMDASGFADVCVDTSGLPVAEVARLVRERTGGWPLLAPPGAPREAEPDGVATDGPVLWVCGATAVGKSTVGFGVYQTALRAGQMAAFVDLGQIGFFHPAPADDPGNHRLKARNLAAVWRTYRAAGARSLTVVGPVEDEAAVRTYADALPAATLTLCRLHAGREQLTRRIMLRGRGGGWPQPGDPLRGRSTEQLLRVAADAAADADALERASLGDLRVDTDGRTVEEAVAAILAGTGWPGGTLTPLARPRHPGRST